MKPKQKSAHKRRHLQIRREPIGNVSIERESNAVLLTKLDERTARALRITLALQHTCEVLDHALALACAPRGLMTPSETPEHYCALAEKAIEEKTENESQNKQG